MLLRREIVYMVVWCGVVGEQWACQKPMRRGEGKEGVMDECQAFGSVGEACARTDA